jgi:hypothetical protein
MSKVEKYHDPLTEKELNKLIGIVYESLRKKAFGRGFGKEHFKHFGKPDCFRLHLKCSTIFLNRITPYINQSVHSMREMGNSKQKDAF